VYHPDVRIVVTGVLLLNASCSFSTDYGGTTYRCEAGVCPPGYTCGLDGYCRLPGDATTGTPDSDPGTPDADPAVPDATPPDADIVAAPPWWDTDWLHRRRIFIQNVSTTVIDQDFPVGLVQDMEELTTGGGGYSQIRIIHHNPVTGAPMEMTRVIDDTAGTDEMLWLPLWETLTPTDTVSHYWIYYGNDSPSSSPPSDPNDLFTFHAPFSATDNRLEFNGTATVGSGKLTLAANSNIRTLSPYRWGTGYACDFMMEVPSHDNRYWGGFQRVNDFLDDEPWIIWIARNATADIAPEFLNDGTGVPDVGTAVTVPTAPRIYSVERFPTATVYRFEHAQIDRLTHPSYTTALQVRLANESSNNILFDWMRIREAVDPPPTATLGPEETAP
jgi:hypothetical protein